tara:strand:+ start:170 stop:850 length:681 start_codon:yes stop_codon:yes gene_type:complete
MIELPDVIHAIIHDFLKLPSSITITNQNIKDNFIDNGNLKMILYNKNKKNSFIDSYKKDLRKLYLLIQKYSYYENEYKRNEPISSILIDLLCTGSRLPFAYSSHKVFTDDTFKDLKEIIRIAPQSLKSDYGQLRCRYYLSPLDMACYNIHIPFYAIKYILQQNPDMYHYYEVNGCKTHIFYDLQDLTIWESRYNLIKNLFESAGFDFKKLNHAISLHNKRYQEMYD